MHRSNAAMVWECASNHDTHSAVGWGQATCSQIPNRKRVAVALSVLGNTLTAYAVMRSRIVLLCQSRPARCGVGHHSLSGDAIGRLPHNAGNACDRYGRLPRVFCLRHSRRCAFSLGLIEARTLARCRCVGTLVPAASQSAPLLCTRGGIRGHVTQPRHYHVGQRGCGSPLCSCAYGP